MVAESLLSETYFGSTISQYAVFFAVLTVGAVVGRAFSFVLEQRFMRKTNATETEIDDIIIRSLGGPVALLGVFAAAALGRRVLTPTDSVKTVPAAVVEVPLIVSAA